MDYPPLRALRRLYALLLFPLNVLYLNVLLTLHRLDPSSRSQPRYTPLMYKFQVALIGSIHLPFLLQVVRLLEGLSQSLQSIPPSQRTQSSRVRLDPHLRNQLRILRRLIQEALLEKGLVRRFHQEVLFRMKSLSRQNESQISQLKIERCDFL